MAGASTEDKINLNQRAVAGLPEDVYEYVGLITVTRRFSAGQTPEAFTAEYAEDAEDLLARLTIQPLFDMYRAPLLQSLQQFGRCLTP